MKCETCVAKCKSEGGLCVPPQGEETMAPEIMEAWAKMGPDHELRFHYMQISEGFWYCQKGHRVEAHPVDAMRAAGVEPLL